MIKVSDRGDGDEKITDNFDLDKELSIIIEKNCYLKNSQIKLERN